MNDIDLAPFEALAEEFVNAYKSSLTKAGKYATGELIKGIDGYVECNGSKVTISIYAPEQWKYVEYGRKPGTFPNLDAILSWIHVKGLPRSNNSIYTGYKGKLPTENQLAFLIGRSIKAKGIPAGNYLSDTIKNTKIEDKFQNMMAKAIENRFLQTVRDEIKDITVTI